MFQDTAKVEGISCMASGNHYCATVVLKWRNRADHHSYLVLGVYKI
jgi:hypothetical protein